MHWLNLQKKLIAVARANPPSDRVPFAFEKRVMALITSRPVPDSWAMWARALWCAVVPCVAVMILFSALALYHQPAKNNTPDLAQQFDSTLFAAVDQNNDSSSW